jgi:hypothetical protein
MKRNDEPGYEVILWAVISMLLCLAGTWIVLAMATTALSHSR